MTIQQLHNVQTITAHGRALYLTHVFGSGMHWTREGDDAFEYEDLDEAESDAAAHGGEVVSYDRPFNRRLPAPVAPTITLIAAE